MLRLTLSLALALSLACAPGCTAAPPPAVTEALSGNLLTANELRLALVPVLDGERALDSLSPAERGMLADKLEANVVRAAALKAWVDATRSE